MKDLQYFMNLKYKIDVREDASGGFIFSIPDLIECIAYVKYFANGLEKINEAKRNWLIKALDDESRIPEPDSTAAFSGQFKLRIPKSLHRELTERSAEDGISLNQYCLYILSRNLQYNAQRDKYRTDLRRT